MPVLKTSALKNPFCRRRCTRKNPPTNSSSQSTMSIDNRRHQRARVKWPVVIQTPTGLVDGKAENLSLSGAFIRLPSQLECNHNLPMVIDVKGRFIPCTTQVVWSDESSPSHQSKSLGIGVRFTRMMLHDREFLYGEISGHF